MPPERKFDTPLFRVPESNLPLAYSFVLETVKKLASEGDLMVWLSVVLDADSRANDRWLKLSTTTVDG